MSFLDNFASSQSKSDFIVEIHDSDWDSDWPSLVSKQTKRVEANFVARTLVFHLRQTKKGIIQDIIFHCLSKRGGKIDHIMLQPGKDKSKYEYHFIDGVVTDHNCVFDYGDDGDMMHVLTVAFDQVDLRTPARDRRTSVILTSETPVQLNG
jgi:hypothetical protein